MEYEYDRFINNFMPVETNGKILISSRTPNPMLRNMVMDAPEDHTWCMNDQGDLSTRWIPHTNYFVITLLSHRRTNLTVSLR